MWAVMKVLFSADHHIKLNTKNIPNEWAINRFNMLFDELHKLEKEVDMHILGGDFFDKLPNMQELELYFKFIAGCNIPTYIIPGNHEALKKDTTFLTHLKDVTSRINSNVTIVDDFLTLASPVDLSAIIDFIPYNKLKEYEKDQRKFNASILVTHVRGDIPPHVKAEVPLELFECWKVVLAGDLHSYSNSQRNILYPGSPITTSFHRSNTSTGVIVLDTDTLDHTWVELDLPQLIRKTIKPGEPMVATSPDHTIYEIEGDMAELSTIEDHELIDKKVVKRSIDTTLILSPEMTIEQEISEYLNYVLELPDETIQEVIKTYHDNAGKIKI